MTATSKDVIRRVVRRTMEMDHNVDKKGDWDWGAGVALYGLRKMYEKTGDRAILDYIQGFVDRNMAQARITHTVNTTAPLLSVLLLYRETGGARYLEFCREFAEWLMNDAARTANGELEHTVLNEKFGGELWVDTVFMAGVFLTQLGELTGERRYTEEGLRQARLHIEKLQDAATGLLYHGYSYPSDNYMSGCLWARGNSWVTISVPEIAETARGAYASELAILRAGVNRQLEGVRRSQLPGGLWPTILTDASSYPETSASAGFVYGMLKGIRQGAVDPSLREAAVSGYQAVLERIAEDGTVLDVSAGTGIQATAAAYNDIPKDVIMPWGQGIVLLMLTEEV